MLMKGSDRLLARGSDTGLIKKEKLNSVGEREEADFHFRAYLSHCWRCFL